MEKRNYTVIECETLSRNGEKRYIVVDVETGEILDDAQGWGYKSCQKAHAGYNYKVRVRNERNDVVKRWLDENPEVIGGIERYLFEEVKSYGKSNLNAKLLKEYFDDNGYIDLPFTVEEFLKYLVSQ